MVYWTGAELKSRLARSNRISIYKAVYGFPRINLLGSSVNKGNGAPLRGERKPFTLFAQPLLNCEIFTKATLCV
jgi:hypothetical protein